MDFATALANLQKTASAAVTGNGGADRRRHRPADDDNFTQHETTHHGRPSQRPRQNENRPSVDPFDELIRFGYRIRPVPLTVDTTDFTSSRPKHLCLLLICIDSVPYFDIWRAWARSWTEPETVISLVVHAKFPASLPDELKKYSLVRPPRQGRGNSYADPELLSFTPAWGSIQLTRAMIALLRQGLHIGLDGNVTDERFSTARFLLSNDPAQNQPKLPTADHFVFVSESCVPVRTLQECTELIWGEQNVKDNSTETLANDGPAVATRIEHIGAGQCILTPDSLPTHSTPKNILSPVTTSWIYARNLQTPGVPRNKYEDDQFRDMHRMIPQSCRWKADQWLLLSRPHAIAVTEVDAHMQPSDQLFHSFSKVSASDEMYFPTALALLGILTESSTQILKRQVTFVDWSQGMRNPASYEKGVRDLRRVAKNAREQGCLFARKFVLSHPGTEEVTGQIDEKQWMSVIDELATVARS